MTKPIKTIRLSNVEAAIWANEGENGTFHNVTMKRSYQVDGEWKDSQSFSRSELPLLIKALDQAHTYLYELKAQPKGE